MNEWTNAYKCMNACMHACIFERSVQYINVYKCIHVSE